MDKDGYNSLREKHYLGQYDSDVASIKMKNGNTVKSDGCVVCCYAMIKKMSGDKRENSDLVKDIIEYWTNSNGDFVFNGGLNGNGESVSRNDTNNLPTIYNTGGHWVLVLEKASDVNGKYYMFDPGSSSTSNSSILISI